MVMKDPTTRRSRLVIAEVMVMKDPTTRRSRLVIAETMSGHESNQHKEVKVLFLVYGIQVITIEPISFRVLYFLTLLAFFFPI